MSLVYRLVRSTFGLLFGLFTRFRVAGRENLPTTGPFILATNHIDVLDPPVLMVAVPRQMTAFVALKWRGHPWGLLLRAVGAIFVNRGEVDRRALRSALHILEQGGVLGMAPEGTRSKTHQLQSARPGIAYLAHLSGAPILPVAVTGTERAIKSLLRLRRAEVCVTFGQPFHLPPVDRQSRADGMLAQADLVMQRIATLLPPEYRGVYGDGKVEAERSPIPHG